MIIVELINEADEKSVVSAIRGICRQHMIDGNDGLERFNSVYSKLKLSRETNPQTRL